LSAAKESDSGRTQSYAKVYAYRSRRLNGRVAHSVRLPLLTPEKSGINRKGSSQYLHADFRANQIR
jgi:hypothetical protein